MSRLSKAALITFVVATLFIRTETRNRSIA